MRQFRHLPLAAFLIVAATSAHAQIAREDAVPTFGAHDLATGFEPDPFTVAVVAGGSNNLSEYVSDCAGFVTKEPDVRINYTAGTQYPLLIGAISESDTTLVVSQTAGTFYCDDDSWGDGDPIITFENPSSGIYLIWVGSYNADETPNAMVVVSESTAIINTN